MTAPARGDRTAWSGAEAPAALAEQDRPPGLGRLGDVLAALAAAQGRRPADLTATQVVAASEPARDQPAAAALDNGSAAADALADAGARLLVVDGGRTADGTVPLVLLAALLDLEPVAAVGTDAGPGWAELVVAVRAGLPAARSRAHDPRALLLATGDAATAHLAGLLAQSAVRRTPVLLDGTTGVVAAALLAERLCPGAARWWQACSRPTLPAAGQALERLGLQPLLDLGLDRPGGATLALTLLRAAAELPGG